MGLIICYWNMTQIYKIFISILPHPSKWLAGKFNFDPRNSTGRTVFVPVKIYRIKGCPMICLDASRTSERLPKNQNSLSKYQSQRINLFWLYSLNIQTQTFRLTATVSFSSGSFITTSTNTFRLLSTFLSWCHTLSTTLRMSSFILSLESSLGSWDVFNALAKQTNDFSFLLNQRLLCNWSTK